MLALRVLEDIHGGGGSARCSHQVHGLAPTVDECARVTAGKQRIDRCHAGVGQVPA
jgi:hypothetical protein